MCIAHWRFRAGQAQFAQQDFPAGHLPTELGKWAEPGICPVGLEVGKFWHSICAEHFGDLVFAGDAGHQQKHLPEHSLVDLSVLDVKVFVCGNGTALP